MTRDEQTHEVMHSVENQVLLVPLLAFREYFCSSRKLRQWLRSLPYGICTVENENPWWSWWVHTYASTSIIDFVSSKRGEKGAPSRFILSHPTYRIGFNRRLYKILPFFQERWAPQMFIHQILSFLCYRWPMDEGWLKIPRAMSHAMRKRTFVIPLQMSIGSLYECKHTHQHCFVMRQVWYAFNSYSRPTSFLLLGYSKSHFGYCDPRDTDRKSVV